MTAGQLATRTSHCNHGMDSGHPWHTAAVQLVLSLVVKWSMLLVEEDSQDDGICMVLEGNEEILVIRTWNYMVDVEYQ